METLMCHMSINNIQKTTVLKLAHFIHRDCRENNFILFFIVFLNVADAGGLQKTKL